MVLRMLGRMCVGAGLAVLLVACGNEDKPQAALDGVAPQVTPLFVLSPDGVGPLNADTPFNLIRIGDAFQELNVAEETHFTNGEKYPVITVKQHVKPLLSINPDYQQKNIFSVVVHDNLVGNKLGHPLGSKFMDVYTYGQVEQCAPGMDEWAGKVMCYAPKTGNILYLFGGTWSGAPTELPPPDVMANWQLEAMVWKVAARK